VSSSTSSSEPVVEARAFARYLAALAVGFVALLAQVVVPNVLIDPFWFFVGSGDPDDAPSYAFETREAKLNRLRATADRGYDCLLSGSSRALTIDPTAFEGHRCFNLAVEGAALPESLALYERAAQIVPSPRLVIQAVDNFDLEADGCGPGRERAARQRAEPRHHWLERYVSLDVLRFSRKSALGRVRGVAHDPDGRPVLDRFEPYQPRWTRLARAVAAGPGALETATVYDNRCVDELAVLRQHFPEAHLTGYISPISADLVLRMHVEGELPEYLAGMHRAARYFDAFYDFGAPSELTFDPSHTWDGSHFEPAISARLARALLGGGEWALRVDALTLAAYAAEYRRRIDEMIARLDELSAAPGSDTD
jgi:hypothetical protein